MNRHDASYRQLFSNPQLVRNLFEGVINEPWMTHLDWRSLQPLPTDFVTDKLRQRQGDLAWRIRRRDGIDLYVLLMLEHQSVNDHIMALLVAIYSCLLYENLVRRKLIPRHARLPLILPVVLYSGVTPWKAPLTTSELIDPRPARAAPLCAADALSSRRRRRAGARRQAARAQPGSSALSTGAQPGHCRGAKFDANYSKRHAGSEHTELRRAFISWTRHVPLPRALPNVAIPNADGLLEIKDMLTEHSRSWTHQWKMEGLEEGRREGRQEGEGVMLRRQLVRKFGPLSEAVEQRLKDATPAQMETWSLNILDATELEDVFTK